VKGGADGIGRHLLQLAGNNGGEQGPLPNCILRLGKRGSAAWALDHAVFASLSEGLRTVSRGISHKPPGSNVAVITVLSTAVDHSWPRAFKPIELMRSLRSGSTRTKAR
jgi:hypothetical protein